MNKIKLIIGMPTHDCLNFSKLTIKSFQEVEKYLDNVDIHFVIVDNNSTDGSQEQLPKLFDNFIPKNEFKYTFIELGKNYGCSKSFNEIYKIFDSENRDLCIFINNDIAFSKDALSNIIKYHLEHGECGIISSHPIDNIVNEETKFKWFGNTKKGEIGPISEDWYNYAKSTEVNEKDIVDFGYHGCLFVVTKDARNAVGNWDENFIIGCYDDTDMAYRMEKAGYLIQVTHSSVIMHYGGVTQSYVGQQEFKSNWYQEHNKQYFNKKYNVNLDAIGARCCRGFFWTHPQEGVNERVYL